MNITNDNMMCNILTVLKRPKRGARGGKKGGKKAKTGGNERSTATKRKKRSFRGNHNAK
jgi:hypothetical protein